MNRFKFNGNDFDYSIAAYFGNDERNISIKKFSQDLGIPYTTVQGWHNGSSKPSKYILNIIDSLTLEKIKRKSLEKEISQLKRKIARLEEIEKSKNAIKEIEKTKAENKIEMENWNLD